MNCKKHQERILESLASGAACLPDETSAHRQVCSACREYYEQNSTLLHSIDSSLHALINRDVPPSLFVGVQNRLNEEPAGHGIWIPGWSVAAVAGLAAILAFSISHIRPGAESGPAQPASERLVSRSIDNSASLVKLPRNSETVLSGRSHKRSGTTVAVHPSAEASPEVIVLPEERQAFARFVAILPKEKDVALALTRPAPALPDAGVEVALLQIGNVHVKPLDSTSPETMSPEINPGE